MAGAVVLEHLDGEHHDARAEQGGHEPRPPLALVVPAGAVRGVLLVPRARAVPLPLAAAARHVPLARVFGGARAPWPVVIVAVLRARSGDGRGNGEVVWECRSSGAVVGVVRAAWLGSELGVINGGE